MAEQPGAEEVKRIERICSRFEWGFSLGHSGYWRTYRISENKYEMEWNLNGNQLVIMEHDITKIYTDIYTIKQLSETDLIISEIEEEEGAVFENIRYFKRTSY